MSSAHNPSNRDSHSADALCAEAETALAAADAVTAIRGFRQTLELNDEHTRAQLGLMQALRQAGRFDQAITIGLRLSVLEPMNAAGHRELAECFQAIGQIPQAEAARRRARVVEWKQQLAREAKP